jgi:hypothetical protein
MIRIVPSVKSMALATPHPEAAIRRFLAVGIIALLAICTAHTAPEPLPPAPARPGASAGPTEVQVAAFFADILRIDSAAQTFNVHLMLVFQWRDPSLAAPGSAPRIFSLSDIWSPRWLVANSNGLQEELPPVAVVAPDGAVVARQTLLGTLSEPMNLRRFPFDREVFHINLVTPGYRPEEIAFMPSAAAEKVGLSDGVGKVSPLSIQDWTVTRVSARPSPYTFALGEREAGYTIEFAAKRNPAHYVLKVILPLVLIVMMSWLVFWIDPTLSASQISVAVTSMLTLIAYRFSIGADVPKLPYLTLLDTFILISSILVFLSLIEVMVTAAMAVKGRVEAARAVDRHSRWAFPLVFLVASAWLVIF